jgi:hypothetical protein
MNAFQELEIISRPKAHFIAFKDKMMLGYRTDNNKAVYINDFIEFNLLSEMGDSYREWAEPLIEQLHYKVELVETETDYYETLKAEY